MKINICIDEFFNNDINSPEWNLLRENAITQIRCNKIVRAILNLESTQLAKLIHIINM